LNFDRRLFHLCRLQLLLALAAVLPSLNAWAQAPVIAIFGAETALEENIRAHLSIDERCSSEGRRLNRLLPQIRRDVERAAQALGFYGISHIIEFAAGNPCWSLQITVEPGRAVRFGEINVNIDTSAESASLFADVLADSPVRSGERLNHSHYESLKSLLTAAAVENGFFSARFNRSELAVDLQRNVADVNLDFDPGIRYQFGEIRIQPISALSNEFISRFVEFEPGTPYSTAELVTLRESFNESQYFNQVSVTPQLSGAQDEQIPVAIELEMRPRRAYMSGIGVSTDTGPRVRFSYEDRYINRRGHRLDANLGLSAIRQEPDISYVIPLRNPVYESLRFSAGYLGEETDAFSSDVLRLGATYRSRVWGEWMQNIFVNFQSEQFEVADVSERTNSTVPGINWTRTKSDDPVFPTRGWRLFAQVSGASENLFSSISFTQFTANAKIIRSLGPVRLLLRAEAATTLVNELEELPASLRFFTGGDTSVRGYQYNALGALNELGEIIGGKNLLAASAEIDFSVRPGWLGAVFYDTGNSFADFGDMNLKHSVGIGARWLSPIGPIRIDIARSISDSAFRLHITMGPDL
jgi:translocation and assembly module TamA